MPGRSRDDAFASAAALLVDLDVTVQVTAWPIREDGRKGLVAGW